MADIYRSGDCRKRGLIPRRQETDAQDSGPARPAGQVGDPASFTLMTPLHLWLSGKHARARSPRISYPIRSTPRGAAWHG